MLSRAGIKVTLQGYPSGTYYADFAGVPSYVHQHDLGLAIGAWVADWPDGYGFLYNLVAGPAIAPAANPDISELDDPVVNNMFTTALATASTAARTPDLGSDRPPGHIRRGHPARRVRETAALPEPSPDQRLCAPVLRHV